MGPNLGADFYDVPLIQSLYELPTVRVRRTLVVINWAGGRPELSHPPSPFHDLTWSSSHTPQGLLVRWERVTGLSGFCKKWDTRDY